MLDLTFHQFMDVIQSSVVMALIGVFWKAIRAFVKLESTVDTLATNHIPHLEAALDSLRESFIRHIDGRQN